MLLTNCTIIQAGKELVLVSSGAVALGRRRRRVRIRRRQALAAADPPVQREPPGARRQLPDPDGQGAASEHEPNGQFEGDDPIFKKIREIGNEFGATTGRPRQVGFLDLDNLVRSARINGVTWLIMNKVDILEEVDTWKLKTKGNIVDFKNSEDWKLFISDTLTKKVESLQDITYSSSPEDI